MWSEFPEKMKEKYLADRCFKWILKIWWVRFGRRFLILSIWGSIWTNKTHNYLNDKKHKLRKKSFRSSHGESLVPRAFNDSWRMENFFTSNTVKTPTPLYFKPHPPWFSQTNKRSKLKLRNFISKSNKFQKQMRFPPSRN